MLADLSWYSADLCHAPLRSFVVLCGSLGSFVVLCGPLWSFAVFSHTGRGPVFQEGAGHHRILSLICSNTPFSK